MFTNVETGKVNGSLKWRIAKLKNGSKVEEQFRLLWISTVIKRETTLSKVDVYLNMKGSKVEVKWNKEDDDE
jgi:hypothetical protein